MKTTKKVSSKKNSTNNLTNKILLKKVYIIKNIENMCESKELGVDCYFKKDKKCPKINCDKAIFVKMGKIIYDSENQNELLKDIEKIIVGKEHFIILDA